MNDLPTQNQIDEQQASRPNRGKQALFWCGFLALMAGFFLGGYYFTGVYRSAAAPATSAQVDITPENEWQQLPPSRTKKVTATVDVSEIAPEPEPTTQSSEPNEQDESPSSLAQEQDNAADIAPQPTPARPPAPKPAPTPPVDTRRYVIQIGIYSEKSNAEIISANLADHGYASSIRQVTRNGAPHYQVIVGNPKDKAAADALAAELRKAGREVAISPVD